MKPKLATYDAFKGWPAGLARDATLLGGHTLPLMSLAVISAHPDETFTPASLSKRLVEKQGDSARWIPHIESLRLILRKLGYENNLLDITEGKSESTLAYEARINDLGRQRAAYVALVLQLCIDLSSLRLRPEQLIGYQTAPNQPEEERKGLPLPLCRLGTYSLLSTTDEQFKTSEIAQALKIPQFTIGSFIPPLRKAGIVDVQPAYKSPLVQFTDACREPLGKFTSDIRSLNTPDGIDYGQRLITDLVDNPQQFSYMMELGATQTSTRRLQ